MKESELLARLQQQEEQIATAQRQIEALKTGIELVAERARKSNDRTRAVEQQLQEAQQEIALWFQWRVDVTAALLNPGGALYVEVPTLVRKLRERAFAAEAQCATHAAALHGAKGLILELEAVHPAWIPPDVQQRVHDFLTDPALSAPPKELT